MTFWNLLLLALVAWTVLGAIGISISLFLGERAKALRHLGWIFVIWAGLSCGGDGGFADAATEDCGHGGQSTLSGDMCFAVTGVEEVPGFLIHDGSRLVRVSVRVSNRGRDRNPKRRTGAGFSTGFAGRRWDESRRRSPACR